MISAQIATAVSSGVRAPTSSPIGDITRAISASSRPVLAQALDATLVRPARAHRAEVPDVGLHRGRDRGHVELVVVGQHAHRVARSELVADLGEVAVGPVVHDLVGHREPLHRREHRARVAHGDAVAEHLRDAASSAAVKSTAPKMIMRGGSANDSMNTRDGLLARLAVLAVVAGRRDARPRARRARRGRRRGRGRRSPSVPVGRSARPHEQLGADVRPGDDGGERDRFAGAQRVAQLLVDRSPVDRLHEQVDRAAAREPDGERFVVGVPERDDAPLALAGEHLERRVRRPRPRRSRPTPSPRPRRRRSRPSSRPDRAGSSPRCRRRARDRDPVPRGPPPLDVVQDFLHRRPPRRLTRRHHLGELFERGQRVAFDELVNVRQRGRHSLRQRRVAGRRLQRVHPHRPCTRRARGGPSARRAPRGRRGPSRRRGSTTTAPRAMPRMPHVSLNVAQALAEPGPARPVGDPLRRGRDGGVGIARRELAVMRVEPRAERERLDLGRARRPPRAGTARTRGRTAPSSR